MSDTRWILPPHIEAQARAMTKTERVDYLKAHGWQRLGSRRESQTWIRPAESWRFFTLAAAIRAQLNSEVRS